MSEAEAMDRTADRKLTPAQKRILFKARFGPCIFRGRHGPAIDALKTKGFISYDWRMVRGLTPGLTCHCEYTVRLTATGRAEIERLDRAASTTKE